MVSLTLTSRTIAKVILTACFVSLLGISASAQNFSGDARAIAMGGLGSGSNDAGKLAGNSRQYRTFVVPLGLFQVLRNRDIYNPGSDEFNPIRAVESIASPVHYTFNRKEGASAERLVNDIVKGGLSRDLNTYRGFAPQPQMTAMGLVSPNFGKTFGVYGDKDSPIYHGLYVGAGPYISVGTDVAIDQRLVDILGSSTNVYQPNSNFLIHNITDGQAAAAITGGYRVKVPVPGRTTPGSTRDGLYISANYNYLRGFHYDKADLNVRFDTDGGGLLTLAPTTTPVIATHEWSEKGHGFSLDLGTEVVIDRWDLRFSMSGIANRIEWESLDAEQYVLNSLLQNLDFTQRPIVAPIGIRRIELPVQYSAGGTYNADRWTVDSELMHGLQKTEFRGGAEYRLFVLEFRGGGRYVRDQWQPAGGVGLNITRRFGVDFAMFSTATNIEKARKATMALSLRISREGQ